MILIKTMKHAKKMGSLKSFRSSPSCSGQRTNGLDHALIESAEGKLEAAVERLNWLKEQWETRQDTLDESFHEWEKLS